MKINKNLNSEYENTISSDNRKNKLVLDENEKTNQNKNSLNPSFVKAFKTFLVYKNKKK